MTFDSEVHLGHLDCSKMRAMPDPRTKRKRGGENQYGAIKHKAWLCGAEGNLLFIKFTPPPSSPPNPRTLLGL